jgi:pyridoxal phosphate enzyme (YggS family)
MLAPLMPPETDMTIAERIAKVQAEIADAAHAAERRASEVTLLAVSKKQSLDRIQAAYDAGLRDFGENYMQGLEEHAEHFPDDIRWHFIGHLQSKKAKRVAWVHRIHSVDSIKLATILSKCTPDAQEPVRCLLNVNISEEASKSGVAPDALEPLLDQLSALEGIEITGLMCIPNPDEDARAAFSRLRELRDRAARQSDFELPELSMGMSDSFREAIAEGATIVRVGTAIFGPRLDR